MDLEFGISGENGESCGNITIGNKVTVEAYGGAGGSGGGISRTSNDYQSGAGGGGYPGAGIGGGGAGGCSGDTNVSGAGFSAGNGESTFFDIGAINGKTLTNKQSTNTAIGGSYYECFNNVSDIADDQNIFFSYTLSGPIHSSGGIGGGCACPFGIASGEEVPPPVASLEHPLTSKYRGMSPKWDGVSFYPDALNGGKGGNIKVSQYAVINAYNGSYITTKASSSMTDSERQTTQALIYAQAGYDIKAIRELKTVKVVNARTISALVSEWSQTGYNFSTQRTIKSPYDTTCGSLANTYVLGIGSGAGGSQTIDGNGTYTIDSSLN